MQSVVCIERV